MSEPTDRRRTFENITLALSLFILLIAATILVLLTVGSTLLDRQQTPDPALEARLEALDVKADEALAAAQTAVAKADPGESEVPKDIFSAPLSVSAQAEIAVDGGVALTYQAADESEGKLFYRVDCLVAYESYQMFKQDRENIACIGSQTTIELALAETEPDSEEYHLLYHEADRLIDDPEVTFNLWSEYALIAELQPAQAGGEASMAADGLTLYEVFPQTIVASTSVVTSTTIEESLNTYELALEPLGLRSAATDKLLLADSSSGETLYTLVVREPTSPAGRDRRRYWCRRICRFRGCQYICR
jgi:hypothetical protein